MMSFVLLSLYIHFVHLYQAFTHACRVFEFHMNCGSSASEMRTVDRQMNILKKRGGGIKY